MTDWCGTSSGGGGHENFQPPRTKEILLDAVIKTAGEHTLDTVQPSGNINLADINIAPEDDFIPSCITQAPIPTPLKEGPSSIMVGLENECPRWIPGSVIRWTAWEQGFKTKEDAQYAADHLSIAAKKWNEHNIGVTFEWVPSATDAAFVLCHGGSKGNTLASAFFPNANDLNYLLVFNAAFSISGWKENMWKVFTHELGHVLGLRHEFAMDINPDTGLTREGPKAVQLGPRDQLSVMNYSTRPPEIQQSDIDSTRAFYALRNDADGNPPKVGLTEVRDYLPM